MEESYSSEAHRKKDLKDTVFEKGGILSMKDFTGLILAGGRSTRMGCDKAQLQLEGKSLLQWQVEKLQHLGMGEILISAPDNVSFPGTRTVPDRYRNCGPIGGLQAGLAAATFDRCLVISVDCPLVLVQTLSELCSAHEEGVTILCHPGGEEPLLGVYDRTAAPLLEEMILQKVYAIRALETYIPIQRWAYYGPEELLCNCNTPEAFALAGQILAKYGKAGMD